MTGGPVLEAGIVGERSVDRFLAAVRAGEPGAVFCASGDAIRTLAVASAAEDALVSGQTLPVPGI